MHASVALPQSFPGIQHSQKTVDVDWKSPKSISDTTVLSHEAKSIRTFAEHKVKPHEDELVGPDSKLGKVGEVRMGTTSRSEERLTVTKHAVAQSLPPVRCYLSCDNEEIV